MNDIINRAIFDNSLGENDLRSQQSYFEKISGRDSNCQGDLPMHAIVKSEF